MKKEKALLYISSPYSHKDEIIVESRYNKTFLFTQELIKEGFNVYSPIVYLHPLSKGIINSQGFNYWKNFDLLMLEKSDLLVEYLLHGYLMSEGMQQERKFATEKGIKVVGCYPTKPINFNIDIINDALDFKLI